MTVSITSIPVSRTTRPEDSLECHAVWGGRGAGQGHHARPGLDLWYAGVSEADVTRGGGEWCFLSSCASGRITRIVLTDVCGREEAATETAIALKNLMKRHVNAIRHRNLTAEIHNRFQDEADEGTFSTAVMATYFSPTRSLSICNAGGPPPLIYRMADECWHVAKGEQRDERVDMSVPGTIPIEDYRHSSTQFDVGDRILIYGNSLADCRDEQGRVIGVSGIQQRLEKLRDVPGKDVPLQLVEMIRREHEENRGAHDLTVLLAEATRTAVGWKRNILAPLRILRGVTDQAEV